jgi:hypothetical protein
MFDFVTFGFVQLHEEITSSITTVFSVTFEYSN